MATERVVVRGVAWRDLCPWLILFRTFGLATTLPILFLATLGALLTPVGWRVGEALLVESHELTSDPEFARAVQANSRWAHRPLPQLVPNDGRFPRSIAEILTTQPNIVEPVFRRFVDPLARLLGTRLSPRQAAYYLLGSAWMLLVWGFLGGAITRMAVIKLGREEQIGLGEALRHAARKLGSYVASPLFPLVGVLLFALPIAAVGLLMRWDWGLAVAALLWIFVLLAGLSITVLLLGLLFGWPLMWGVISSERDGDAFEAFSRSYSYTFQRPLHYLFYALLAVVYGALGWLLVYHVSEAVIDFCRWPAALGAGADRWQTLVRWIEEPERATGSAAVGAAGIALFEALVRTVAIGFGYSLFWCLTAAIYLLLRRDVDQTEFDDVFVDRENSHYELPALKPLGSAAGGEPSEPLPPTAADPGSVDERA